MVLLASLVIGAPAAWIWPTVATVVLLSLLVIGNYRRAAAPGEIRLLAGILKIIGIVALAVCVLEPLFSGLRPRPGANVFVILADKSQSMQVQEEARWGGMPLRQLLDIQAPWYTRLEQDFDVRDYAFDAQLANVTDFAALELDGISSSLGNALDTISARFAQRPMAGVLLFTDGNATDLEAVQRWSKLGFPVYPVLAAEEAKIRDIRVDQLNVSQTNFETSPITVGLNVQADGFAGEPVIARIVDQQGGAVMAEESGTLRSDGQPNEFRFRFRPPTSGVSFFRTEVFAERERKEFESRVDGAEQTWMNNSRMIAVDRGGGPYRILYVGGRPNWEYKFLRRALDEDDEITLIGLLRIAKKEPKFSFRDRGGVTSRNRLFQGFDGKDDEEAEQYDQPVFLRLGIEQDDELRDGFPKTAAELFVYDAIVLDDIEVSYFSPDQQLLIRRFVSQRGGGLLMAGGQECFAEGGYQKTPIGELLPVYVDSPLDDDAAEARYTLKLTREGWLQSWTRLRATEPAERSRLAEMSPFRTLNRVRNIKPGANILATVQADDENSYPALVTQRFGKGRSAALLVGDLWRWAMHQADPAQQDLQQSWRQTVRWLVAEVPRRAELKIQKGAGAAPVSLRVLVRDGEFEPLDNADVTVTVTTPQGESVKLAAEPDERLAGLYAAQYWPRADGGYRVEATVTAADGEVLVARPSGWTSQPAADEFQQLQSNRLLLAELASATGGQVIAPDALEEFVQSLPNRRIPVTEAWVYPLWHQPWVMFLAIACLCGEWGLRRWKGLA